VVGDHSAKMVTSGRLVSKIWAVELVTGLVACHRRSIDHCRWDLGHFKSSLSHSSDSWKGCTLLDLDLHGGTWFNLIIASTPEAVQLLT